MAARNAHIRNPPKQYVPSMQGNKYQVALAQITTSLGMSETSMAFAQMFVKLMSKGIHQRADIIGMVMAQVSLKAALKKWGREAEESVGKEMKPLESIGFILEGLTHCSVPEFKDIHRLLCTTHKVHQMRTVTRRRDSSATLAHIQKICKEACEIPHQPMCVKCSTVDILCRNI
jgi:hypothetical protein